MTTPVAYRPDQLFSTDFDRVVDSIDTRSPKVYRLSHVRRLGLSGVGNMGSGGDLAPADNHHIAFGAVSYMPPFFGCHFAAEVIKTIPQRP